MKKSHRKYNPTQCQHRVIAEFSDAFGNKVALLAHHAFKWSIYKESNNKITITQMPRIKAKQEYKKIEKAFHPRKRS